MDLRIVKRIDELKQRLSHLRCQRNDAMTLIAIEAVEQELARTAARLPREWDLVSSQSEDADVSEGGRAGSRWWL